MFYLIVFIMMTAILTTILTILGQILPNQKKSLEKSHPYECGFDPMKSPRLPFSFRFFLVAMLFLIFDLEMALLLPLPFSTFMKNLDKSTFILIMFLLILSAGLYFEWTKGGLEWAEN